MNNSAKKIPGAVPIPLSSRQQLSDRPQSLPRYNEILIALERARVENEKSAVQKAVSVESKVATAAKERREDNRPDVLNVLIASPSDVNDERDAVTRAVISHLCFRSPKTSRSAWSCIASRALE